MIMSPEGELKFSLRTCPTGVMFQICRFFLNIDLILKLKKEEIETALFQWLWYREVIGSNPDYICEPTPKTNILAWQDGLTGIPTSNLWHKLLVPKLKKSQNDIVLPGILNEATTISPPMVVASLRIPGLSTSNPSFQLYLHTKFFKLDPA